MSRSNIEEQIKNPATVFMEWSGSKGCLKYWDKEAGEKGEEIMVKLPFSFIVLDKLSTISGFSDADKSGYWSNEVRDTRTDILTVRTKKGVVAEGLYSTFAPIKAAGACYAQSLYIAYYNKDKELIIGNLKLSGSAIGPWIDFTDNNDIYKIAVTISGAEPKKKGNTNYFEPVFTPKEITPETNEKAIELDKILQEYLTAYFKRGKAQPPADVVTEKQKEDIGNMQPEHGRSNHVDDISDKGESVDIHTDNDFPGGDPADDLPF